MRYICPEYEIQQAEAKDVITFSLNFNIFENEEDEDKVEYIAAPEGIFG